MSRSSLDMFVPSAATSRSTALPDAAGVQARVLRLALVAAILAALGCLWAAWCEYPFYPWNDTRLAPAFALRHGINPYPGLGEGPVSTWIYGPIGILINLPVTFAPTALAAVQSAWVINTLVVIGPLAVILFGSTELRARGTLVSAVALAIAIPLLPKANLVLQAADHCAIAFGLLSCWCLARHVVPGPQRVAAAAGLCALAIWSKQLAVFLIAAHVGYLWMHSGRRAAVTYVRWVLILGAVALAVFAWAFGLRNLWLNLVEIPGRLPWAEFWPRVMVRPGALFGQIVVPAVGLLVMWRRGRWPSRDTESGRYLQVSTLAAAAMLPVGLAGFFKIGGDTNLLHSWDYLLPAVLLFWLARDDLNTRSGLLRTIAAVTLALAIRANVLTALPTGAFTRHFAEANTLMSAHPGKLWFPQHPVLSFFNESTLWHSEDGLLTRYEAGFGLRERDFRRHLPPHLDGVVYPSNVDAPAALSLLPEFSQANRSNYCWTLHTRPMPAPIGR